MKKSVPDGVRVSELMAPCYHGLHRDICEKRHREYWFSGGRGSGKSSFVSLEIVLGLLRDKAANAIIYRKVGATLRESVYEQILWAIRVLGVHSYFRGKTQPLEIEYIPTGQRILFRGGNDPGKSKSMKLADGYFRFLWFEEAGEFSGMDDLRSIKASILRGGKAASVFLPYNPPPSARSWINSEALIPRNDRLLHRSTYLDMPPAWLGEDFLAEAEHLRGINPRLYRNVYLGETVGTGGQVFDNLRLGPVQEGDDRGFCGLDFGFACDPDAFIRARYDRRTGVLTVLDEFYAVRCPLEVLSQQVSRRASGAVVRCDSADPRMIRELRSRGIQAVGAKKGPGSVEHGLRWLQECAEIRIDPDLCPNAAREFTSYEYPADGSGNFLPEAPDRNNHLIDALRYAVEEISSRREAVTLRRDTIGL